MRVLVVGARGMLGHSLVPVLRDHGHDVLTVSRSQGDIVGDVGEPEAAARLLAAARPDAIVNLAALTDVDGCEREPDAAYRGNVRSVEHVARWVRDAAPDVPLVHISTDQLYDGPGPHQEAAVRCPNVYALSKYAGELAAALAPRHTILRTNFFGRSLSPGRGSLTDWLARELGRGAPVTVFEDVQFSPLSMPRLAQLIAAVLATPRIGVFNLGSRVGMTKAEFAWAFARAAGLPDATMRNGTTANVGFVARRPADMRMNSAAFESAFDVTLPTLAEEILLAAAEYRP